MRYVLTNERNERGLRRICCISNGKLGGWLESEENLSQSDEAWVCDNAQVYGGARVFGNARVSENAEIHGNAQVYGNAQVLRDALVYDNAQVYGNAGVFGAVHICDTAEVYGNSHVSESAQVFGNARVSGDAHIFGGAQISGEAEVSTISDWWAISSCSSTITYTRSDDSLWVGDKRHTVSDWLRLSDHEMGPYLEKLLRTIFADRVGRG